MSRVSRLTKLRESKKPLPLIERVIEIRILSNGTVLKRRKIVRDIPVVKRVDLDK
jgi:hypothetical protein